MQSVKIVYFIIQGYLMQYLKCIIIPYLVVYEISPLKIHDKNN